METHEEKLKRKWLERFALYLGWRPEELPQEVLDIGKAHYAAKNGLSYAIDNTKRQLRMPPYHDA